MNILYVALGSAVGGVCRYVVSQLLGRFFCGMFPFGTFVVNVVGCFVIGLLYGWIGRGVPVSAEMRLLLVTGFCGGFTTFSTFMNENYMFLGSEKGVLMMCLYTALSLFVGLLMLYWGHKLSCAW